MADFPYRCALIIGVGTGISASLARHLSKIGLQVGLAARDVEKLKPLAEETAAAVFAVDASQPGPVANPTSPTRADFCDFRRAFRQQAIVSNDPDRLESAVVPTKPLARRKTRRESGSCFYATRFAARTARCIGPGRSSRTGAPRVGA